MTNIYFSKVNTKNIKSLTDDVTWLSYAYGTMGTIRKCDSEGFDYCPNNGQDKWFYITFKSAVKLKKELSKINEDNPYEHSKIIR